MSKKQLPKQAVAVCEANVSLVKQAVAVCEANVSLQIEASKTNTILN